MEGLLIEAVGWISTGVFLLSIVAPKRERLHQLGILAAVTTGIYAYYHGATAIWVKWFVAFFFHLYMLLKCEVNKAQDGRAWLIWISRALRLN